MTYDNTRPFTEKHGFAWCDTCGWEYHGKRGRAKGQKHALAHSGHRVRYTEYKQKRETVGEARGHYTTHLGKKVNVVVGFIPAVRPPRYCGYRSPLRVRRQDQEQKHG